MWGASGGAVSPSHLFALGVAWPVLRGADCCTRRSPCTGQFCSLTGNHELPRASPLGRSTVYQESLLKKSPAGSELTFFLDNG